MQFWKPQHLLHLHLLHLITFPCGVEDTEAVIMTQSWEPCEPQGDGTVGEAVVGGQEMSTFLETGICLSYSLHPHSP